LKRIGRKHSGMGAGMHSVHSVLSAFAQPVGACSIFGRSRKRRRRASLGRLYLCHNHPATYLRGTSFTQTPIFTQISVAITSSVATILGFALLVLSATIALHAPASAQDLKTVAPGVSSTPSFRSGVKTIFGERPKIDRAKPLHLQGDELIYDNKGNRVTARGNVELFYNDFILKADEVIYDQGANTLTAVGNVVLKDPNGGITRGEQITLTDDFRDGFIQSLSVTTKDQSRITARRAIRRDGTVTEFQEAKFSPCRAEDGKPPLWCVAGRRVIQDTKAGTITYQDAQFEFLGTPIFYLPYFQHADPSVKRKSGVLVPEISHSEDLGFMSEIPYYFALSPSFDFTFHPMYAARQGILWKGDWRHKLAIGSAVGQYTFKFAFINQDYNDLPNSNPDLDGWRGSIVSKGEFSLASWWKFGWDVTVESDDEFRRFYKLDSILKTDRVSKIYLTGQSERNYFSMIGYHFGGLLLSDTAVTEGKVHPVIDWNYVVGQPVAGGELSWNVNALSFTRALQFTDVNNIALDVDSKIHRVSADINWRRKLIDRVGITYTPFANLRGDVFSYANVPDPTTNRLIDSRTVTRGVASAGILAAYPWLARTQNASHVVEPLGQIIVRTAKVSQSDIPNEDARSLVFDDTNLFDISKFSGYDRVETGTRANVGVQYTFQANGGPYARLLAGQSFHLSGNNPYAGLPGNEPSSSIDASGQSNGRALYSPESGLGTTRSDYVMAAYLAPSTAFKFIGQARFNEADFTLRRADAYTKYSYGPIALSAIYAYTADATDLDPTLESGQEISARIGLQLTDRWSAAASIRYDVDSSDAREAGATLRYSDDCFILSTTYIETYITDQNITPDRTIMVRFQLKHIGDFRYRTDALDHLFSENQ